MAVADATTTLRITQTVLAQDFREPAVLAKELATLDVLSEGRLQVGLGAGWLRQEYEDASMRFDSASVRIERLEETAVILRGLFSAEPFSFHGEHYRINDLTGAPDAGPAARAADHDRRRRQEGSVGRRPAGRHRPVDAEQPRREHVARPVAVRRPRDRGEDRLDPRRRR